MKRFFIYALAVITLVALSVFITERALAQQAETTPEAEIAQAGAAETELPGDPDVGAELFNTFQPESGIACSTCHGTTTDERTVGPGLHTVGERAENRDEDLSAEEYLRESILDPGAYVVPGYIDMMPKNFEEAFTEEEVDDLVAYLMTLEGSEA
jgi:cytochrome c2